MDQGLYREAELAQVPEAARNLSRGCGNPTGFADLQPGETVVDFGCGRLRGVFLGLAYLLAHLREKRQREERLR